MGEFCYNSKNQEGRIFLSPPHLSGEELELVKEAVLSNFIAPLGPMVDRFEKLFTEYVGIEYGVALASGTAAMHLALKSFGVGEGDAVIASDLTFIGSVTPIVYLNAEPVFIDSERQSWNMCPGLLEEELTRRDRKGCLPKVVVPTDLYGQCSNYDAIYTICDRYGVPVVVDAAEALGAKYFESATTDGGYDMDKPALRHAGYGAGAAVYSFNGNKIITTSGGGMLASSDRKLIDHARYLSQQAKDPAPYYEHSEIGYNYRLSNILAAIGIGQLRVVEQRVARKKEIFRHYQTALQNVAGIEFMPVAPFNIPSHWLTVILISQEEFGVGPEHVRLALEAANIESRPVWKPMHLQPVFQCGIGQPAEILAKQESYRNKRRYRASIIGGQVATDLFRRGLCLPSGTALENKDLDRVVEIILECRKR